MEQRVTASSTSAAIRLEDVRLTLASAAGPVNILNGVSLEVAKGEDGGAAGPVGLGQIVAADGGRRFGGRHVGPRVHRRHRVVRHGRGCAGAVSRAPHRHRVPVVPSDPDHDGAENVAVPLELRGAKDAFARARAALDAVGLSDRAEHYPSQLSGGEQQRVALARAIVHEPEVLFADEPTGNLDGATGAAIIDLLFALRARVRATLFLVTHEEALAARCDRMLRMKDGLIVAEERSTA